MFNEREKTYRERNEINCILSKGGGAPGESHTATYSVLNAARGAV